MITKDLIASPLFSLAILRDVSGDAGYLALGGVPPISFTQDFTSTPILVTTISGYPDTYDFYTINIDEVVLNGASVSGSGGSSIQYIVSLSPIPICLLSLTIANLTSTN
jgi:aspergillopepsin I